MEMSQALTHVEAPELAQDELADVTFWVSDDELIQRVGGPRDLLRMTLAALDNDPASGFPRKVKIWGDRRYWPGIKDYWKAVYGCKIRLLKRDNP
jgi:hypothetical protein